MKIVLKKKVGTKWSSVPVTEIVGQSVCSYLKSSKDPIVAALYEGDEPIAFLSNDDEYVEMYKKNGLSLSCDDLELLTGTEVLPSLIAQELAGSSLVEIKVDNGDEGKV